jgi:putative transposase
VTKARELTTLRREVDFVRAVSQTSQQYAFKTQDEACRRFFKGLGGYPQPKKKGVNDAFTFNGREITIERLNNRWGRVRLPKIGWVKFRMTRNLSGKLTEATVSLTPLGWQISIGCKDCDTRTFATDGAVGIDRGVSVPLMLSDGTAYMLPERLDVIERRARKAQRILARRERGSNRHAAARIRKHWAHETTTAICRNRGGTRQQRRTEARAQPRHSQRGLASDRNNALLQGASCREGGPALHLAAVFVLRSRGQSKSQEPSVFRLRNMRLPCHC